MSLLRRTSYSAFVCPAGVHAVAYHRVRGGIQVERCLHHPAALAADDVARTLAELLEADGARRPRVSIAVTGFGACHQILTLPRADRDVLRPIAARELRRFYPGLFADEDVEPIVDYVELGPGAQPGATSSDLLVAGIPRRFVHTVVSELAARGACVEHWTIAPRALQRLYDAFAAGERTAAALVMVPDWPLLGFFHDRELRLFSEPLAGPGGSHSAGISAVAEQVERGTIFLRQQFRGAAVSHLYLADETPVGVAEAGEPSSTAVRLPVTPFGPASEPPGALAALGAALDAAGVEPLNLLPAELRPPTDAYRSRRRTAVASACLLLAASGWWGWSARRAEAAAHQEVALATERLEAERSGFASSRPILEERQAHTQRAALIELLTRDQRRLPEVLWPLQAAAPDVEVRRLQIARQPDGWEVVVGVTATAESYDRATDAIVAVSQRLGAQLPEDALSTSRISLDPEAPADSSAPAGSGAARTSASVEMSFIIPALGESLE